MTDESVVPTATKEEGGRESSVPEAGAFAGAGVGMVVGGPVGAALG